MTKAHRRLHLLEDPIIVDETNARSLPDARKRLLRAVRGNWIGRISTNKEAAWRQLCIAILQSDEVKQAHKGIWDKERQKAQKSVADEIQAHLDDELTLALRVLTGISYRKLQQIRIMLGFKRKGDGTLTRLKVGAGSGVNMPTIETMDKVQRLVSVIREEADLEVRCEDKLVIFQVKREIIAKVKSLGKNHPAVRDGLSIQLLGDGYSHFRRLQIVNFAYRIAGAHAFANSVRALQTAAIWEDGEDYETVRENTAELRAIFKDMNDNGLDVDFGGDGNTTTNIPCSFTLGGDMKWLSSIIGMKGYEFALLRLQGKSQFADYTKHWEPKTVKICHHLSHVVHEDSDFDHTQQVRDKDNNLITVTGIWCYGCQRVFTRDQRAEFEGPAEISDVKQKEHRRTHFGHGFRTPPLFGFIEFTSIFLCILHLLLRVAGALWKGCVGKHVTSEAKAKALTKFLHEQLRCYVPPIKSTSKAELYHAAKQPSFTGEEAARVCEHFQDCVDVVAPHGDDNAHSMSAMKYFIQFYNDLNTRVWDATKDGLPSRDVHVPLLKAKADRLRQSGKKFIAAFIRATDAESVTPYITTLNRDIPAMCEQAELVDMSGQALELLNQMRKHVNTSRGGGSSSAEGSLLVHQLAVADVCESYVRRRMNVQETTYQRERLVGGREGKQFVAKRL